MLKSSMKIVAACEKSRCLLAISRINPANNLRAAAISSSASSTSSSSGNDKKNQHQTEVIRPEFGLLFDIDGVLVRGKTLLPHTKHCIRLITDEHGNFRVPTVFVTNAGNELRSTKAAKLSNFLGVYIDPNQVVMSHSPLKLFKQYHNMRCLVSGQGPIVEIAKNLGFKSLITIDDLRQHYPHLDVVDHKRRNFAPCALGRYFPPIEAIVLFGESIRWETNLQLIIDVLMSSGKLDHSTPLPSLTNLIMSAGPSVVEGEHQNTFPIEQLPILACNADMVWMAEAAMPRFGHGVFLHCLEQIYAKLSGRELKYQCIVGKPNEITYYYAEQMVQRHAASIGLTNKVRRLYAVGDNLDTDIYGANVYNQILENNRRSREKKQFQQQKQQEEVDEQQQQQQAILSGSSSTSYSTSSSQSSSKSSSKSYDISEQESAVSQQRRYSTSSSGTTNKNENHYNNHHRYMDTKDVVTSHVSDAESIRSILVRTGVFRGGAEDASPNADSSLAHKDMVIDQSLMKPSYISDNVFDAVKLVYELEKFS